MRVRSIVLFVVVVAAFVAPVSRAQGLPDPRSGLILPQTQAAAVDDGSALLVNPAGLAFSSGLEFGAGATTKSGPSSALTLSNAADASIVVAGGGLAVGGDVGALWGDFETTRLRATFGTALLLDDALAIGASFHSLQTNVPGVDDTSMDLGAQLRPTRFFAVGVVGEQIGRKTGSSAVRAGISWRPLDEFVTVGIDVRAVPGATRDAAGAWATATWTPALATRFQWGGLGVFAGVALHDAQAATLGIFDVSGNAGVQLDLDRVGVAFVGGSADEAAAAGLRTRVTTTSWPSLLPRQGRWLQLELGHEGEPVRRHRTIFDELFEDAPSSAAVLAALDDLAEDPSVSGLVLQLSGLDVGWARAGELRAALARLRSHGKRVVVHFDVVDDVGMFVASAADRIWMSPSGTVAVDGLRAEMVYVGEALRRLGFAAEAVAAGRYKSAPRAFTHDAPSPEELEVEAALLDGIYAALVGAVAQGRGLSVDDVKSAIDQGGLSPGEALKRRFVDALFYADELPTQVASFADAGTERTFLESRFLDDTLKKTRWDAPSVIAFIPIVGTIRMGRSNGGFLDGDGAGSDDIVEAIREAADDDAVRAIVLRVDSPGGDALASDLIWRAAMLAREKKPVIATMGDVAASGGYYVASAADEILAEGTTVTGSIGVFGLMFNAENFAADHGVGVYEQKRGALPGPTLLRGMTDEERTRMQASVDATYERFLDAVVQGRTTKRLSKDELRLLAEGRVWTGAQALERKLVDREGSVVDALKLARDRANLAAEDVVDVRVITGTEGEFPGLGGVRVAARSFARTLGLDARSATARAMELLVGDPDAVAVAIDAQGRPLALGPGFRVR
jgi:protease-4